VAGGLGRARADCSFDLAGGSRQGLLDPAREFVLPLCCDERILAGHFEVTVTCDLAGFDGATADLLPPSDVGATEGVWPQAGEVAVLLLRGLV